MCGELIEVRGGPVVVFDGEFSVGHAAGEKLSAVRKVGYAIRWEEAVDGKVHGGFEFGMGKEVYGTASDAFEGVAKRHGGAYAVTPVSGAFFPGAVVFDAVEKFCEMVGAFLDDVEHFVAYDDV